MLSLRRTKSSDGLTAVPGRQDGRGCTTGRPAREHTDLFARYGHPPGTREECHRFAAARVPGTHIRPSDPQGYCSYTLLSGDEAVVQFRPAAHMLDLSISTLARDVFGDFAPSTKYLGIVPAIDS